MSLHVLLAGQFDEGEQTRWLQELSRACEGVVWHTEAGPTNAPLIEAAVVANPLPGSLRGLPRLAFIQSLWAGVERILADESLPLHLPLARMVDPAMTQAMVQTALWACLSLHRGFFAYQTRQREGLWRPHGQCRADEVRVLVLGAGVLGSAVGDELSRQGYVVNHWRTGESAGAAQARLSQLLPQQQIVFNLLPLTAATRGLLDERFFSALPRDAALVNLARGAHVVDEDLLAALDSGRLRHAVLDVFHEEPLPAAHPFWAHPKVTVLPHAAAMTDERSAARVVAKQLERYGSGEQLLHLVRRERGY